MKKKIFSILILICSLNLMGAIAVVEVGANVKANLEAKIHQYKNLLESIEQTKNQVRQIEMEMTNMMSLTQELTTGQLQSIMRDYQELLSIQQDFKDKISSFKNFEQAFKDTYTDFKNLEGLSADEYINKADDLLTATREMTQSAFAVVGLGNPEKMANDAQRITALMNAANGSEGQKAVLQAGVNMAGEQTRILGELRTLLASSLKTQNAEEMRRIQKEKAMIEYSKKIKEDDLYKNYKPGDSKVDMTNRRW